MLYFHLASALTSAVYSPDYEDLCYSNDMRCEQHYYDFGSIFRRSMRTCKNAALKIKV